MARAVKPPAKRSYDSSRRQAQARETQAHIATTARTLFIERGYTATSIRDITNAAGVALQTIYNSFDGKPAIVCRIIDIAAVGDDEPVALLDREVIARIMAETDPGRLVDTWADFCTTIFVRFLPVLPVIRDAAAVEPTVAEHWRRNAHDNRLGGVRAVAARLDELGAVPAELGLDRTAEFLWAHVSFDTAEALMSERGWTAEAFTAWTARLVKATLGIA